MFSLLGIPKLESRNRFDREIKSSLYKHSKSCLKMKNFDFSLILKSRVFMFYSMFMADTWFYGNIIVLDFIGRAVVTEKRVYANVSNLSAGILSKKSAFSLVIDILKRKSLISMNRLFSLPWNYSHHSKINENFDNYTS